MSNPSNCQICRAKFSWFWRHRHPCKRCGNVVCSDCSSAAYRAYRVSNLDFNKEEICDNCVEPNNEELEEADLLFSIDAYETGYKEGYETGYREGYNSGYSSGHSAGYQEGDS